MKTIPKRLLSLLLVLVVVLGCMPTVYATTGKDSGVTEATTATEAIPPAAPTEEETIPPSSSAPTISEKEPAVDNTTEATEATVVPPESDSSQDMLTGSDAATYASTQNSIMLFDSSIKTIVVTANETTTVTFRNTHYGDLKIKKNAVNGSAEDWSFQILDENKALIATISTDQDGYATSGKLFPGKYYVVEVHDRDETYWTYDATVERQVTVTAGKQAEVTYTNEQFGRLEFQKTTNTGNHLAGWVFRVKDTDGNHILVTTQPTRPVTPAPVS